MRTESTPDEHADDLSRLIAELGAGPVDLFASSGGAVNALVLVARHPEQVRILVAHEPPAAQVLPDREPALAASRDIHETYLRAGMGSAMAKFIALVSHQGLIEGDYVDRPAPDPAMFGLPSDDDGSRNDPLLGQNLVSCTHQQLDFDALRAASTRIVIGAGAESDGELANRAAGAWPSILGRPPRSSPATMADSWEASTARRATPTPSPKRCR
ncbi:MAG: alpha/beta hydrolase [Candidatus Limnocylindrales bacterium]